MIYFAYFHSILDSGIIFWGNFTESRRVLLAQKRIIRIMTGSNTRASCKPLFQSLGILTLTSTYILSLMKFLLQHQERYTFNTEVHNINTINKLKLHQPINNLTLYQRWVYHMSINIFNKLPEYIMDSIGNKRRFISRLKEYLVNKSYYSLEEFMNDWYHHLWLFVIRMNILTDNIKIRKT